MNRTLHIAVSILLGLLLFSAGVMGQDTSAQPDKPLPPDTLNTKNDASQEEANTIFPIDTPKVVPDTRPLAGVQALTLGTVSKARDFLLPSFSIVGQAQIAPQSINPSGSGTAIFRGFSAFRVALNHTSEISSTELDYLAGGTFSIDSSLGNSLIQSLDFAYSVRRGRWTTTLGDSFNYLSASPFGFGGIGGLGSLGIGLGNGVGISPGFLPNFLPDQSVFIDGAPRIGNAVVDQEEYALTHRSSLTFAGSFQMLKFIDAGFADGYGTSFQAGYNYAISRKDNIAIAYQFNRFAYFNASPKVMGHGVVLTYARRVTGRLSFQAGAGPQVQTFAGVVPSVNRQLSWTFYSGLSYELGRTNLNGSYSHFLAGGSGLFLGTETDLAQGVLQRSISREWDGSTSFGYSRNQPLKETVTGGFPNVNTWYATGQVNRHFIRFGSLFLSYTYSHQSNLAGLCLLPTCSNGSNSHAISLGYTWGLRPVVL